MNFPQPSDDSNLRNGLPVIPRLPPETGPSYPNGPIAVCGECNRLVYKIECYYCSNMRCPIQLKVIC